ncbi:hypothetical protein Zmor_023229 [Zophobas morio]|uniref:Protein BUD31 homolog n=1 Tax=Zophobas morio TaxID=2755281 RepID=A0AA38HXL3_9CUCU|nr:hypothetical protein Zmor_023229 [Zophobas morio]
MPKVRRSKKTPKEGRELNDPTLDELAQKMGEVEIESHEDKRRSESLWPIFTIAHQRSKFAYDLFCRRKATIRELHGCCLPENTADKNLTEKWRNPDYKNLCCVRCTEDTNFGTSCICRVLKGNLDAVGLI